MKNCAVVKRQRLKLNEPLVFSDVSEQNYFTAVLDPPIVRHKEARLIRNAFKPLFKHFYSSSKM